jgi:ribose transport system ATP-binding protein
LKGNLFLLPNPLSAQSAGITIIHQEFNLFPELTVEENIFIGREFCKNNRWRLDEKQQRQAAIDILQKLNLNISPETLVADLTVAQQQMVEIAKAISVNAKILIMDEPTAALGNGNRQLISGDPFAERTGNGHCLYLAQTGRTGADSRSRYGDA